MRAIIRFGLLCLLGFLLPLSSFAWNAVGHMVVAKIAYDQLQPDVRAKVDRIMADFAKEYPSISSYPQLAVWMDELRYQRIESFTHWHYIDLVLSGDGTLPSKNIIDTDNAVWAIKLIQPVLKNNNANAFERGRFLAFLTHIVGDIHQPLHGVSRVTAAFPEGDRGGNLFRIQYQLEDVKMTNLHSLWDSGLGVFSSTTSSDNVNLIAKTITTLYPKEYFGQKIDDLKPEDWANDDMQIAKTSVYNTAENQVPSTSYIETGKQVARQQAALAGYRLALMINQLLS